MKILHIEDEPLIRKLVKAYLKDHEVVSVSNGRDAMLYCDGADIVICDYNLGDDLFGDEIVKRIRVTSTVPIIAMSSDFFGVKKMCDNGANFALGKPVNMEVLADVLSRM